MRSLLLLSVLLPSLSFAWGFDGHMRLASLMQNGMPAGHCLRNWYSAKQTSALQDHACDPDRWRYEPDGGDPLEWPRHFLEVDWANPVTAYPRDFAAVQAWKPQYAYSNGYVPWRVQEMYAQLVDAFAAHDEAEVLDLSFVLSHYVFDSFSLLHDTKNFDPDQQPDGSNGLHGRWESDMLGVSSRLNGITTLSQTYLGSAGVADPLNNIFDMVNVGNGLVGQLIAADQAALAADAGIVGLYNNSKDLTARRWADGIVIMSSILWTAWNEAGRPELSGFTTGCSRAAPVGDPIVNGYPPPGGFTHAPDAGPAIDAGAPDAGDEVDAGLDDAGTGGGTGGGTGATGGGYVPVGGAWVLGGGQGGGGGDDAPVGCGCTNAPGATLALLGFAGLLRRRRR